MLCLSVCLTASAKLGSRQSIFRNLRLCLETVKTYTEIFSNVRKKSELLEKFSATLANRRNTFDSPVILLKIMGKPATNCNRRNSNSF